MNPSRLLRTALFSALGLLVAGGLMTVQAQTIVVDQDGGENATEISDGLDQLASADDTGDDNAQGTLVVVAGDYTSTDANLDLGDNSTDLDNVTLEVREDGDADVQQLTVESIDMSGGTDVTLQSTNGNEFLFIQDANGISPGTLSGVDLALQGGTLTLAESDVLRLQDGAASGNEDLQVYRGSGSSISGEAPNYAGNIDNIEYEATDPSITASNELGATSLGDVTLVEDLRIRGDASATASVTFPVDSLAVDDLDYNGTIGEDGSEEADVTVEGDFSLGDSGDDTPQVSEGDNLTVEGTFELRDVDVGDHAALEVQGSVNPGSTVGDLLVQTVDNSETAVGDADEVILVDGDGTVGSDADEGDVTFDTAEFKLGIGSADVNVFEDDDGNGTDGQNAGTVTVQNGLTLTAVTNDDGSADNFIADASLGLASDFDLSTVSVDSDSGPDNPDTFDETFLDIENDNDGIVTAGGSLNQVSNESNDSSIELTGGTLTGQLQNGTGGESGGADAASVTISGDVTYDYRTVGLGTPIQNSAVNTTPSSNEGSEITIESGARLEIEDTNDDSDISGSNTTVLENNGFGGVSGAGDLEFDGNGDTFTVTTVSGETQELNSDVVVGTLATLEIEDEADASGDASNINVGDLTTNGSVTLGAGDLGQVDLSSLTVNDDGAAGTDSDVSLSSITNNGVIISGSMTLNGETADFTNASGSPDLDVQGDATINASSAKTELNLNGITAHFKGDLDREADPNAEVQTNTTSTVELNGSGDATLSPGSKFTIDGNLTIDKVGGIVTLTEALAIAGDVDIDEVESQSEPNNELKLEDNLFLSGGSTANFTLDAEATSDTGFFIIVDGSGDKTFQQNTSDATLTSLRVNGNGDATDVIIGSDLEFTSEIDLVNGGIQVASNTDFSAASSGSPKVTRNLNGSNTEIDATNGGATFNDDGNAYDLEYDGGAAADVASEFTDDVENLDVTGSGTIAQLTEDNETINGALTVEAGAQIGDEDDSSDETLTLAGSGETHSIVGTVFGNNGGSDEAVVIDVTGSGSTIEGSTDDNNASVIEDLTASATGTNSSLGVTVSDIQRIRGDVSVPMGGSLNLGLADAGDESGDDDNEASDDQTINGSVTVEDTLALASDIELTSSSGSRSDVVSLGENNDPSNARLEFGDNNLRITGQTRNFNGDSDAEYASTGGTLVLDNNAGTNAIGIATAGVSVPNVAVPSQSGTAKIIVREGVSVSDSLDVNDTVRMDNRIGGDSLAVSGKVVLRSDADFESQASEPLITKGTTIDLEGSANVDRFVIDSGSETTVTDDGDGNTLIVDSEFEMRTGDLGQDADIRVDGSTLTYGADAGSINRSSGDLILNNGSMSFAFEKDFTIPYLSVEANETFDDDDETVIIGSQLTLQNEFDFGSADTELQITDGSTIVRDADDDTGVEDSDILDEDPSFPSNGTYDVVYQDSDLDDTQAQFDSGRELAAASDVIGDVTINPSESDGGTTGEVYFEDENNTGATNAVAGAVTVNGTLTLESGELDYGRQLTMGDRATLVRTDGGELADVDNTGTADNDSNDPAGVDQVDGGTFALEYEGASGFDASDEEFPSDVDVNVVTRIDDTNPNNAGVTLNLLPGARTIDSLRVENGTDDDVNLGDGTDTYTLTVSGPTDVNTGDLIGGTLDANGEATIAGGTVTSDVDAGGDFVFESGTLGMIDLAFDGSSDQNFQLANGAQVSELEINSGGNVSLTGAPLGVDAQLDLSSGLLIVEEEQFVALSQQGGAGNGPLTVDNAPGTAGGDPGDQDDPADVSRSAGSHIVGTVQQGLHAGAGNPEVTVPSSRFEYPVGTEGEFRQLAITFDSDDPLSTDSNVRVTVSDENPGGTLGLSDIDGVGSYPEQFFRVDATTGISSSQTFDIELETGTQGFTEEFSDADNLRIIRRFVGDTEENRWRLQGQPSEYQNALFTRNGEEFTSVRAQQSTGGLVTQGTVFALGLPGRVPEFIASPGDQSVDENESTGDLTFEARSRDVGQDVTLSLGDLPSSVDPDSVSFEAGSPDDTTSATLEFTPGFEGVDRELTFTVNAEDGDGTTSSSLTVSVADVAQGVAFADGSAPSDADGTVARDTARSSDDPATFTVTAEPEDPSSSGSDLSFSTDVGWATAEATSASDNQATGTVTLEPGFAEAQSAAQGDGSLDVQVTATDDNTGESASGSASVDVRFDRALGDVDGSGSITSFDASLALSIAVGKTEVNEEPIVDAQVRAADFVPPSEGDTLDAEAGDVNSFDALQIFQSRDGAGGATAAATSAAATSKASRIGQADGGIRVGEMEKKGGTSVVSIVLDENAGGVQAADVEVDLSDAASVKDVQTSLPKGWISSHNTEDGTLKIGMAGERALPSGKIATVQLDASGDDPFSDGNYRLNGSDLKAMTVEAVPSKFSLGSNYPNPVESETTIEYELKESSSVTLEVYNTLGQKVATLVDQKQEAGDHSVAWKAGDDLSSGVYFYRMQAGDFTETKRITVVR